ncbi:MAG: hypothetical protein OES25_02125 [Acidobacteriota bacterium]|nr:hypothetical protein [Acidobacteriota bacterium]
MDRSVLNHDTSRQAEDLQVELWRRMSQLSKIQTVSALSRSVLQLSLTGIRQRFPEATDRECKIRLARLTLGPELANRAYPESSKLTGY